MNAFWKVVLVLIAALVVASVTPVWTQSTPAYRYQHLAIWDSGYVHPTTGEGLIPSVANQGLAVGWELVSVNARYVPTGPHPHLVDFVFLAPVGVAFPLLPHPNPSTPAPTAPPATPMCPGYPTPPVPGWTCYPDGGWRP